MDESPYKAPREEGPQPPAKKSEFLDPMRNAIELFTVVVILALLLVAGMMRAGSLRF